MRPPAKPAVWLCEPGKTPDPCVTDLTATAVSATGARVTKAGHTATGPPFDCFYVYPTVSTESGPNSDLRIQPEEIAVAQQQASRFSSVCQVWAPMYRQVTLTALFTGGLPAVGTAYQSLQADWLDYLQHHNDGRPIIFIGHSQGAAMLIMLLAKEIDPSPVLRRQMVVAILAGGNVQVPVGRTVGGSFQNIPLCPSSSQPGCVIAYSTFGTQPPADTFFGRPTVSAQLGPQWGYHIFDVNLPLGNLVSDVSSLEAAYKR